MPCLTQFLAEPMFSPMPEVTVAAGGRVFKAFGLRATHANQNALLNTLMGINGYNGAILWKRPLRAGFMLDRNTMIATADILYLADDESCKLIDARTGKIKDEIVVPEGVGDGKVWKWMALDAGPQGRAMLYALVGGEEVKPKTEVSANACPGVMGVSRRGRLGLQEREDQFRLRADHRGHRSGQPRRSSGSTRNRTTSTAAGCAWATAASITTARKSSWAAWTPRPASCSGRPPTRNCSRPSAPAAPPGPRGMGLRHRGFIKCNDKYLFFAGPQRPNLVVASAEDGKLLYQQPGGYLHLILRDDGFYAIGGRTFDHRQDGYQDGLRHLGDAGQAAGPAGLHPGHRQRR